MQVQVEIAFEQLVQIAKELPERQWLKLKVEVESQKPLKSSSADLEEFLLNGPTFSEEQIDVIEENRKAIDKWRRI